MADLELTRDGVVATLTPNRPERLNAFSDEMLRGLLAALEELAADTAIGAIVLTGAGRAFCAGGDVKAMSTRAMLTQEQRIEDLRWKQRIPLALKQHPKPIIAMINGSAFGAGLGLTLRATSGWPRIQRGSAPPSSGSASPATSAGPTPLPTCLALPRRGSCIC